MERANRIRAGTLSWSPSYSHILHRWSMINISLRNAWGVHRELGHVFDWLQLMVIHLVIHSTNIYSVSTTCLTVIRARDTAVNKMDQIFCFRVTSGIMILIGNLQSPLKISCIKNVGVSGKRCCYFTAYE